MSAILDLSELLNRVENDREFLAELINIFKAEFPAHIEQLNKAIRAEDANQIERESHTLKGMLLNLSATQSAAGAGALEKLGREKNLTGLNVAFAAFQSEIAVLLSEVERRMGEIQP